MSYSTMECAFGFGSATVVGESGFADSLFLAGYLRVDDVFDILILHFARVFIPLA